MYTILIYTLLKSRYTKLTGQMGDHESYFQTRRRRDRLQETSQELRRRLVRCSFPHASWEGNGFEEATPDAIYQAGERPEYDFSMEQMDLLADIFLLSLDDGTTLFEQQARYGDTGHLFFHLLERGLLIDPDTLEEDPQTGNKIMPLDAARSYLDDYARIPVWQM